jgi:type I restriction enzyme M protein
MKVFEEQFAALDAKVKGLSEAQEDEDSRARGAERRRLSRERTKARQQFDFLAGILTKEFSPAITDMSDEEAERAVLGILGEDLFARFDARLADALRGLLDGYRAVASKYEVSLERLEAERDEAAARLTGFLTELGYPRRVKRRMPEKPALS